MSLTALPRVDVLMVYQGAPGDLIKAAADQGAQGIVIASAGAGATSGTQRDGQTYAEKKGVIIVMTKRTGSGRIAPRSDNSRGRQGNNNDSLIAEERRRFVAGEDLAPLKARILLMLALTKTRDHADIQRMFSEY